MTNYIVKSRVTSKEEYETVEQFLLDKGYRWNGGFGGCKQEYSDLKVYIFADLNRNMYWGSEYSLDVFEANVHAEEVLVSKREYVEYTATFRKPTVTFNGVQYDKEAFEEAIKHLEAVN